MRVQNENQGEGEHVGWTIRKDESSIEIELAFGQQPQRRLMPLTFTTGTWPAAGAKGELD